MALNLRDTSQTLGVNRENFEPDLHREESDGGGGRGRNGGEEIDNDLSAPTPESTKEHSISQPVFVQSSHTWPPGREELGEGDSIIHA